MARTLVGGLAMVGSAGTALAQCAGADDAFEDNDSCAAAVAVSSGFYGGLRTETLAGDSDAYRFEVPAGEIASFEVLFSHEEGNIDVLVWEADCLTVAGFGFSGTDNERVEVVNGGNDPFEVVLQVFVTSTEPSDCSGYDLVIASAPDPCSGALDDVFAGNGDCASAAALFPGSYRGLQVFAQGGDFYGVVLGAGEELEVACTHAHGGGDVNLYLFDPTAACGGGLAGGPLASAISQTDDELLLWRNQSGSAVSLVLEVSLSAIVPSGCSAYDLDVGVRPSACAVPDDGFEDNDTCETAVPFPIGSATGLFVSDADPDFYRVQVGPGEVLHAECSYAFAGGALALGLWDPTLLCGAVPFDGSVAASLTPYDGERLFWRNDAKESVDVVLGVVTAGPPGTCNAYDLMVDVFPEPCSGGLGEILCVGVPNSTGQGAVLCATGSIIARDNDVTLAVSGLPQNAMGFFIVSMIPVLPLSMAGGSAGELCIASPRIGRQFPVLNSGASGTVTRPLDLTLTPQPKSLVTVVAGETWCWQFWHRDTGPGGNPTSNYSSARAIEFQ